MEKLAMKQYAQNIAKVMYICNTFYYTDDRDNDYNTTAYQSYYYIKCNYI